MFLPDADMDKASLRQGDILKNVLYPLIVSADARFLGSIHRSGDLSAILKPEQQLSVEEPKDDTAEGIRAEAEEIGVRKIPAWKCQLFVRFGFAAVISQCCDIEPTSERRITRQQTIALARVVGIPPGPAKDPAKLESLRANKYPMNPENKGYLNYFYLPANERLDGRDWIVDYSQVLSIPVSEFPGILERKVLQMTDDARIRFKMKLAASYGRLMPEEEESGHPWLTQNPDD
ncbi:MAG: hypothetical protein C5B51_17325 [Terriglobia bacterium]|nr:MAG: hypothetical protein C5B51_17325 [Terriglobia bacterium]